jgi:type II secretory pathway predicted ATPase ExeA
MAIQQQTSSLSVQQLRALGLKHDPFSSQVDADSLYTDSHLEMIVNVILQSLKGNNQSIVLLAERGLGKTTLLRKILQLTYSEFKSCAIRATDTLSFEDVCEKLKTKWNVGESSSSALNLSIENHLICYLEHHPKCCLIIDDAHSIDMACLTQLFNLKSRLDQTHPHSLFFIFAGEAGLKLKMIHLDENTDCDCDHYQINVRPLNRQQTTDYIQYRINRCMIEPETSAQTILDSRLCDEIYAKSQGNFDQIHALGTVSLKQRYEQPNSYSTYDSRALTQYFSKRLIIVLALLVTSLLLLFSPFVNF